MTSPENQFYRDMAAAYALSTTAVNKALSAAYKKYADATTPINPPVLPPVIPPTGTPIQGDWTSTADGQTIDGTTCTGYFRVNHNNVRITNFGTCLGFVQAPGKKGLIVSNGIIHSDGSTDGVQWNEYTMRNVEITNTFDGVKAHGNVLIEDCYFHDNMFRTGAGTGAGDYTHNDAVQISSGSNVIVRRCKIENWRGNSGLFADPDQGSISTIVFDSNTFNNVGNYPIYIKSSASNPSTGLPDKVTVTNNIFGVRRTDTPPEWGPMLCEIHATNLTFTGNKTADGKTVLLDSYGKGYVS